jgi:hypothetical protein
MIYTECLVTNSFAVEAGFRLLLVQGLVNCDRSSFTDLHRPLCLLVTIQSYDHRVHA